ncbi:hypothetical protein FB451DRAFT_1415309 [Mycena latifolia]|nr:hypothetical protein FB451DRAFT_1415309 [Mycena latifolia]
MYLHDPALPDLRAVARASGDARPPPKRRQRRRHTTAHRTTPARSPLPEPLTDGPAPALAVSEHLHPAGTFMPRPSPSPSAGAGACVRRAAVLPAARAAGEGGADCQLRH